MEKPKLRIDDDEDYAVDGSGDGVRIYDLDDNFKKTIIFTNISVEIGNDLVLSCTPHSPHKKVSSIHSFCSLIKC